MYRTHNATRTPLLQHPDTLQGHHQEELTHMPASTRNPDKARSGKLSVDLVGPAQP